MKKANQNGGGGGEEGGVQIMADSADSESDSIVDPDIRLALGRVTLAMARFISHGRRGQNRGLKG